MTVAQPLFAIMMVLSLTLQMVSEGGILALLNPKSQPSNAVFHCCSSKKCCMSGNGACASCRSKNESDTNDASVVLTHTILPCKPPTAAPMPFGQNLYVFETFTFAFYEIHQQFFILLEMALLEIDLTPPSPPPKRFSR